MDASQERQPEDSEHEESERREEQLAGSEAAGIGGRPEPLSEDPATAPLAEAGEGEAEGFEQAEELLIEHASHGDEQSAHAVLHHQGSDEESAERADGEADRERSSETDPRAGD